MDEFDPGYMSTSYLPLLRRSHSFDDLISLDKLEGTVWPRKCRSLCDKRWDHEDKNYLSESSSEDGSSDCETVASADSRTTFDRLLEESNVQFHDVVEKEMEIIQPQIPEKFDIPVNVPGDFSTFRAFHQWTPSSYSDILLDKNSYSRPTPSYIWKIRRQKYRKPKTFAKKRFEVLDLESDIDTADDEFEEEVETEMEHYQPKQFGRAAFVERIAWLKDRLVHHQNRTCSSDAYSDSSDSELEKGKQIPCLVGGASNCKPNYSSSEEELCHVDRDSDYEYSHVLGESDSGQSDISAKDNIDSETDFLEASEAPVIKGVFIQKYDAPSPEPFLPSTVDTFDPRVVKCVHDMARSDALALDLMNLDISVLEVDMPHVSKTAPPFVLEKSDALDYSINGESEQSSPVIVTSSSNYRKRNLPPLDVEMLENISAQKLARLDDFITSSKLSFDGGSPPSPASSSIPSLSPPPDIVDLTQTPIDSISCEFNYYQFKKNPRRGNLKLDLDSQDMSPYPSPDSDFDSPTKNDTCGYYLN